MKAQTIAQLALILVVALGEFGLTNALAAENPSPAPLVVNNRTVFVFRAALLGYSPKERASAAAAHHREHRGTQRRQILVRPSSVRLCDPLW